MPDTHPPNHQTDFVPLGRRFADVSDERFDNDLFRPIPDQNTIGWPELLTHRRVVLLAAAGAGKTWEMRHQAVRLTERGCFAFVAPMEAIAGAGLVRALDAVDRQRLRDWRRTDHPAWLFLDAADELKLTRHTLRTALRRVSDDIGPEAVHRLHAVISSRPSDWNTTADSADLLDALPLPPPRHDAPPAEAEQAFLDALHPEPAPNLSDKAPDPRDGAVRQLALLPLSNAQILEFASRWTVDEPDRFFDTLDDQDAWSLARQPLDLVQLILAWNRSKQLGTHADLIDSQIAVSLTEDPDRRDPEALPDTRAREGAERLALALLLTRNLALATPHPRRPETVTGALDPATVLPDWTPSERDSLLRLPLFEPAAYGRIRFRHRSLQEYLAARHLATLRDRGMGSPALHRHLFRRVYGADVVIPSRRPIAGWLALWDHNVRAELLRREPEVLLCHGDPQALSIADRRNIMRAMTRKYGAGGYSALVPGPMRSHLRRFAHPDLGDAIAECWPQVTDDVFRQALLVTIELGPILSCVDIAEETIRRRRAPDMRRVLAATALLACHKPTPVRESLPSFFAVPDASLSGPPSYLAFHLFPGVISVDDFMALAEPASEAGRPPDHTHWMCRSVADTLDPASTAASALRDRLADRILAGCSSTAPVDLQSSHNHLSHTLATLCWRQLSEPDLAPFCESLFRACAVASLFVFRAPPVPSQYGWPGIGDAISRLRHLVQARPALRRRAFWATVAVTDALFPGDPDPRRYALPLQRPVVPATRDRPWLLQDLEPGAAPQRRPVALHALLDIWRANGRRDADLEPIRATIADDPALRSILSTRDARLPPEAERVLAARRSRGADRVRAGDRRIAGWRRWRRQLLDDPEAGFSNRQVPGTLANIVDWLHGANGGARRHDAWNRARLAHALGDDVADRFADALRQHWRRHRPQLWSERAPAARNRTPRDWVWGFIGLRAESEEPGWATRLSDTDACTAARYATLGIEGFAPFVNDLALEHPNQTVATIGPEVATQVGHAAQRDDLPTLRQLAHANAEVRALLAPSLLDALRAWPDSWPEEAVCPESRHLAQLLRVLHATSDATLRQATADECARRCARLTDPGGPVATAWLSALFATDARRATDSLIDGLDRAPPDRRQELADSTFGALFGTRPPVGMHFPNPASRPTHLARLWRAAHAHIDPANLHHDPLFGPRAGPRDRVTTARQTLFAALLDTPGADAHAAILSLAEGTRVPFSDRVRVHARRHAANDSEPDPHTIRDLLALETRHETPPRNPDELRAIVLDRLADIAYDYRHGDFSNHLTIGAITRETEMQRTLAQRLRDRANGAYDIAREAELADSKRTDIRISAPNGQSMAVEIKIARNWSGPDLQRALAEQLVGYLRDADCNAGCLLLVHRGNRRWRLRAAERTVDFGELIGCLSAEAAAIETARPEHRLAVFGLDFRHPARGLTA